MINQLRNPNFYILLATDLALFSLSLGFACALRFNFNIPVSEVHRMVSILPWVMIVKASTFFALGVYQGMWRYTSLPDAWRLLKATLLAMVIVMAGLIFVNRFQGYPRSVFLADSIFTLVLCGAVRAGIRMLYSTRLNRAGTPSQSAPPPIQRVRLILIGAGDAGDTIIRELQGNPRSPYSVVCCLDDNMGKHHRTLLGIPIRGPICRLGHFAEAFQAAEVLIALPSTSGERMREIVRICEQSGLPFKTLPSISSLIDGKVTVNDLRPVNYEDLLGRPAVKLSMEAIGQYLEGKTVAVTGAGGSIGSELCRQIIRFKPARLVLIESSEYNLYRIEIELRTERNFNPVCAALARVQDGPLVNRLFDQYRPHVVFHAAACKHVPLMELNPWEAVVNNVEGSQVIMDASEAYGVERCVFISTDKAVRPTNVMGASKRVVETLLQARPPGRTRFMAVRFGNVVGSSGSVVPLFQRQIQVGGPVTVTHPDVTRFFMTIPEACQLVLQAGSLGEDGEIFILEMGTPVRIADMARDLIRLSGKEPDRDIEIVYTSLRPGEKLYEELITQGEGIVPTSHERIMVLKRDALSDETQHEDIYADMKELINHAATHDAAQIKATLQRMVPEYTPSATDSVLSDPCDMAAS